MLAEPFSLAEQRAVVPVRRRGFSAEAEAPNILAWIFPQIPSPQQTERLPRCQLAPRMLYRVRRPRFLHVSSAANASKDAEV
jgi:hypothetical protein